MKQTLITPQFRKKWHMKERECLQQYLAIDGTITTDIEKAKKNPLGNPIVMGVSKKHTKVKKHDKKPLSFNPKDKNSRLLAMEARNIVNSGNSLPQVYDDNFAAIAHANNSANAIMNKLNQSSNPPENE